MYVTAHLVRSHLADREGINAFIHGHGTGFSWPRDAATLPEENPGRLMDEIIRIRPGGNSVRAYLDFLAPDETPPNQLIGVLNALPSLLENAENPTIEQHQGVTIRFGVERGLLDRKSEQLNLLITALRPLLEAWSVP